MTGKQYKTAIAKLGLSQEATGELFFRSARQGQRWAVDGPPAEIAFLLKLLLDGRITRRSLRKFAENFALGNPYEP